MIKNKIIILIGVYLITVMVPVSGLYAIGQQKKSIEFPEITFSAQDRILILAPHPDDEVLGCCGIIQQAKRMNAPIKIVFFTYGDNNQWSFAFYRKHPVFMPRSVESMGLMRHYEAIEAGKVIGMPPEDMIFLGYPDFRTLNIWYAHWGDQLPAVGMLTHVKAVPYKNAYRPGAPYKGEEILQDLKTIFSEFKPTKIFVSHPGDHNADHRALYLFTRVALWELGNEIKPDLYPYMIHYKHWPLPYRYHPERQLLPPEIFKDDVAWKTYNLRPEEIDVKRVAVKKHHSQYRSSRWYLLSFIKANELFGDFPSIKLKPDNSKIFITSITQRDVGEIPEELIDEERVAFVGIQERTVCVKDDNLIVSIKLSRPIGKAVRVSIYIFGYRSDIPFAKMPKLHIKLGALWYRIFDQNKTIHESEVRIEQHPSEISIGIPLKLLGSPQKILTSAQTYLSEVPLDWVSWRVLELYENTH